MMNSSRHNHRTPDAKAQALDADLDALAEMNLDELRAKWRRAEGCPPPLRSVELLRLLLAWRLQAKAYGGLERAERRRIKRSNLPARDGFNLGEGAVLSRQWQGRRVEVIVEANGFRWDGDLYKSLSAAATAIAGTKWNGPRFFGLRPVRPQ
jgi:hypothetical protein